MKDFEIHYHTSSHFVPCSECKSEDCVTYLISYTKANDGTWSKYLCTECLDRYRMEEEL